MKTFDDNLFFEISDSGNFLRIELIGLIYPKAELEWDRNWIATTIKVKAGGFNGQFKAELTTMDFNNFKKELIILYDKLNETANFNTLEGYINLKLIGDGFGHINIQCELMDTPGMGNKLEFEFDTDQTAIPKLIRQLDDIQSAYPVTLT